MTSGLRGEEVTLCGWGDKGVQDVECGDFQVGGKDNEH